MKPNLPLRSLITSKKLAELREEYNRPQMTKQDAYKKITAVNNFIDVLKSFGTRNNKV